MKTVEEVWKEYVEGQSDFPRDDFLNQLAFILKNHPEVMGEMVEAFLDKKSSYTYQSRFGSTIEVVFLPEEVHICRIERTVTLSKRAFVHFLDGVDKVYSDLLPLGTVVELDKSQLPQDLVEALLGQESLYVMLMGRKVIFEGAYVDYIAQLWPLGLQATLPELAIHKTMIKRVVALGYGESEKERLYVSQLREVLMQTEIPSHYYLRMKAGLADED